MKTLAKLSLTLLAATVISACGSSSGGSDNSNSAPQATPSQPTTVQPTRPTNTDDEMGTAFRTRDSEDFDIKKATTYKQELVVDGKRLPVAMNGIKSGGFTNLGTVNINGVTYKGFTVSGTKYANVKFGHIDGYVFSQGEVTPNAEVPKSGTATYAVEGVLVKNGIATISKDHTLTADFGTKTISGQIAPDVNIQARIEGNEFDGRAVHASQSAELEGHFYGSNAAEIGGAYSSPTFSGAFGGKKQ